MRIRIRGLLEYLHLAKDPMLINQTTATKVKFKGAGNFRSAWFIVVHRFKEIGYTVTQYSIFTVPGSAKLSKSISLWVPFKYTYTKNSPLNVTLQFDNEEEK